MSSFFFFVKLSGDLAHNPESVLDPRNTVQSSEVGGNELKTGERRPEGPQQTKWGWDRWCWASGTRGATHITVFTFFFHNFISFTLSFVLSIILFLFSTVLQHHECHDLKMFLPRDYGGILTHGIPVVGTFGDASAVQLATWLTRVPKNTPSILNFNE